MVNSTSLEVAAPAQYQMVWGKNGETGSASSSGKCAPTESAQGSSHEQTVGTSAIDEVELSKPLRRTHSDSALGAMRTRVGTLATRVATEEVLNATPLALPAARSPSPSGTSTPTNERIYTPAFYSEVDYREHSWAACSDNWAQFVPVLVPMVAVADGDVPPPDAAVVDPTALQLANVSSVEPRTGLQPAAAKKELTKLRKKLKDICKIEEKLAAGGQIDPMQQSKLDRKSEVEAEVARAEAAKAEAERLASDEQGMRSTEAGQLYEAPEAQAQLDPSLWTPMPWLLPQDSGAEALCEVVEQTIYNENGEQVVYSDLADPSLYGEQMDFSMYSIIEQAQMLAEMRAAAEGKTEEGGQGGSRRRRRGARGRVGPLSRVSAAELIQGLQGDEDARAEALNNTRGSIYRLSMEAQGCRVVQLALETADTSVAAELVAELHGHVRDAIESPHGNYVIQKVVEVMPGAHACFVTDELQGAGAMTARHRYGCRILCRLLEHQAKEGNTVVLIDEMLEEADDLCRHSFGHHVIQCVLEYSPVRQQKMIISAICNDLVRHVWNRNASFVIEKVLTHCSVEEQRVLLECMVRSDPKMLTSLGQSRLGPHIAKALPKLSSEMPYKMLSDLRMATGRLHSSKHGMKRLNKELGFGHSAMPQAIVASA